MNLRAMFNDQRLFNRQIWTDTEEGRLKEPFHNRLRHLSLGMVEETLEFLRTFEWKSHRKRPGHLSNVAHQHEELVDMFKYWLSLAELAEFPIDQLEELYYAKSRVVQYRYQEEWTATLQGHSVVVDIDNVLADYVTGFCRWAREWAPSVLKMNPVETAMFVRRMDDLQNRREWIDAESVGLHPQFWKHVKHHYRTNGGKRVMPLLDGAHDFLRWCRTEGWNIILVTSRPIDAYPNLFTDTLTWLYQNELPFDYLWWADDKGERIDGAHVMTRSRIVFAVDDDPRFISQYRSKGVKAYWLNPTADDSQVEQDPTTVRSLADLMKKEKEMRVHA